MMKWHWFVAVTISLGAFTSLSMASESQREAKQAELDARCEAARQQKLAPERAAAIETCVKNEEKGDRAACERFYRDYGERSGNRGPKYYWLPACEEAQAFLKSDRNA